MVPAMFPPPVRGCRGVFPHNCCFAMATLARRTSVPRSTYCFGKVTAERWWARRSAPLLFLHIYEGGDGR